MHTLSITTEHFPVAGEFRIAHGTVSRISVVTVTLTDGVLRGRGECRPYPRYGESPQSVTAQIEDMRSFIERLSCVKSAQHDLQTAMPPGAARNALDCALWDLRAKQSGRPVWQILGAPEPAPLRTAYTLSIDNPAAMARAALKASRYSLLKIKIKDMSGLEAALRIMEARPECELIIDANEALTCEEFSKMQARLSAYPVILIEQPIAASMEELITPDAAALPIACADEALHVRADLERLWKLGYRAVNIKLDKCGGLTEGYALMQQARSMGFVIMAGCMVGTSLAMAPMLQIASLADVVDLDGPVLLSEDRADLVSYKGEYVFPPKQALWG